MNELTAQTNAIEYDSRRCSKCGEDFGTGLDWDGVCIDCWPGYDLCLACDDYRCEHIIPIAENLSDPEFTSCHCHNTGCRAGFVEGSTSRIVTRKQFEEIKKSWGYT
jgi:hypothetical protein